MPRAKPIDPVERKTLSCPASLWKRVSDYRFAERIPSQSEAVRILLLAGLRAGEAQDRARETEEEDGR